MTREESNKEIAELLESAHSNIKQAEVIANEHNLSFNFSLAYGMGGTYYGTPDVYYGEGWIASSETC